MQKAVYSRVDPSEEGSSHAKLIRLCGANKRVVDFGCWTGLVADGLKKNGCFVLGIEIDPEAAQEAGRICDRVVVADLDTLDLNQALDGEKFDVGFFGDIVEHLKDPARVLVQMRDALSPDGFVVVSVPNVAHVTVRLKLLMGDFDYMEAGILDDTHLKYFTRKGIRDLLESCGYLLDSMDRTVLNVSEQEVRAVLDPLGLANLEEIITAFSSWEATAFQYIVKAFPATDSDQVQRLSEEKVLAERKLARYEWENVNLRSILGEMETIRSELELHVRRHEEVSQYARQLEEVLQQKNEHICRLEMELPDRKSASVDGDGALAEIRSRLDALERALKARSGSVRR